MVGQTDSIGRSWRDTGLAHTHRIEFIDGVMRDCARSCDITQLGGWKKVWQHITAQRARSALVLKQINRCLYWNIRSMLDWNMISIVFSSVARHFARQISLREDSAEKTVGLQQPVVWYNWFSILTDFSREYEPQPSGMLKSNHYVFQHPDVRRLGLICPSFPPNSIIDGAISHPAELCRNHGGLFAARYKNNNAKIATKTLLINKNSFAQHIPKQNDGILFQASEVKIKTLFETKRKQKHNT